MDVAVSLGGETPAQSYLRGDAIIGAAKATGADAIHPGYGFLAGERRFRSRGRSGGTDLGRANPRTDHAAGRQSSREAGCAGRERPTTPIWEISTSRSLNGVAPDGVPMPALVKAAAGGGGRGMRIVTDAALLAESITSASREAKAAFGDGAVFIEPYIERGRHVEVQIIGDQPRQRCPLWVSASARSSGATRRVIEESPSCRHTPRPLGRRLRRCRGVSPLQSAISGAGTVEFLGRTNVRDETRSTSLRSTPAFRSNIPSPKPSPVSTSSSCSFAWRPASHLRSLRATSASAGTPSRFVSWPRIPSHGLDAVNRTLIASFEISDDCPRRHGLPPRRRVVPDYDSLLAKVICPCSHPRARLRVT